MLLLLLLPPLLQMLQRLVGCLRCHWAGVRLLLLWLLLGCLWVDCGQLPACPAALMLDDGLSCPAWQQQ